MSVHSGTLFRAPHLSCMVWKVDDRPDATEVSLGITYFPDVAIFICHGDAGYNTFLSKYGVCHISDTFLKHAIVIKT